MSRAEVTASPAPSTVRPGLAMPQSLIDGTGRATVRQWVLTRAAMLTLLVAVEGSMTGDVSYYARSLHTLLHGGVLDQTLQEYPIPVLGILLPQYLVAGQNQSAFMVLFAASMLAVDGLFTALLWRACGRTQGPAVTFWIWFVALLGPITYFRFDVVPAALTGAALLATARRPAWTGVLTALGAGLKLWPALMLPVFLVRRSGRAVMVIAFVACGAALALVSVAVAGYDRSVSPLHWQTGRGLQIESLAAAPLMLARSVDAHGPWTVALSAFKAYEIAGPGVSALIKVSTAATVVGIAVLVVLWARTLRHGDAPLEVVGWLLLATAAIITLTNKVLSPQYMLWLAGPCAALSVWRPWDADVRRARAILIAVALLTHLVYPLLYSTLVNPRALLPLATLVLEARNVLLLVFAGLACRSVWQRTARAVVAVPADVAAPAPAPHP